MSKFCQNCGNMLEDSALFCEKCGTRVEEVPQQAPQQAPQYQEPQYQAPQQAPQYQAPQYGAPQHGAPQYGNAAVAVKKNPLETALQFVKDKKIFFIGGAAALVLIIVLIIIFSSCASNSPKGAMNKAFNSAKNLDIRGYYSVDYNANFDGEKDAVEAKIKEYEEQMKANSALYDMAKSMLKDAKLNVTKDEKVSDEEFNKLKEDWSSYRDADKISEIHKLEYEITGMGGLGSGSQTCYAVKVGGKWYVKGFGAGMF